MDGLFRFKFSVMMKLGCSRAHFSLIAARLGYAGMELGSGFVTVLRFMLEKNI